MHESETALDKDNFDWDKFDLILDNKNIDKTDRVSILSKMNFASPYVELPKKLTVKQNLEIYGRLYGVKNLEKKINLLMFFHFHLGIESK